VLRVQLIVVFKFVKLAALQETFQKLEQLVEMAQRVSPVALRAVVGTKADLPEKRAVPTQDALVNEWVWVWVWQSCEAASVRGFCCDSACSLIHCVCDNVSMSSYSSCCMTFHLCCHGDIICHAGIEVLWAW